MARAEGETYVKLWRRIAEWEWYHDDRCARMFIHLLIKARYLPGKWLGQDIVPGQLPTSTFRLAEELGWSRSAVVRTLEKLKKTGEVDTTSDSKWTLVTVVNWAKWQGADEKPDSKPNRKRTVTGQQPDTLEERKPIEGKKENTEGSIVWPEWSTEFFRTAWGRWKAYKAERGESYKPIGEQMALSKFARMFSSDAEFITQMEFSMANNYQGIFPARTDRGTLRPTAPKPESQFHEGN